MMSMERIIFDRKIIEKNSYLIGVDEAGRGPLAGPIVVCGTKISRNFLENAEMFPFLLEVNDSKKLSAHKRERLFQQFALLRKQRLLNFTTFSRNNHIIDQINILEATTEAMNVVISRLFFGKSNVILDGNQVKNLRFTHFGIVKGDCQSFSIAMASIIAKVTRDRIMAYFHAKYPEYNFVKHKGYGTAAHFEAIKQYRLSPIHRINFCNKFINANAK